jgi:hypothetical protein
MKSHAMMSPLGESSFNAFSASTRTFQGLCGW